MGIGRMAPRRASINSRWMWIQRTRWIWRKSKEKRKRVRVRVRGCGRIWGEGGGGRVWAGEIGSGSEENRVLSISRQCVRKLSGNTWAWCWDKCTLKFAYLLFLSAAGHDLRQWLPVVDDAKLFIFFFFLYKLHNTLPFFVVTYSLDYLFCRGF